MAFAVFPVGGEKLEINITVTVAPGAVSDPAGNGNEALFALPAFDDRLNHTLDTPEQRCAGRGGWGGGGGARPCGRVVLAS
jgi:hypothetical protein